ncbi:MAG TPA: hypothetical protein VNQ73_18940 [Ilumatobacter sp.]|nr:hypothetical protein [Ilumatobacter sp.]
MTDARPPLLPVDGLRTELHATSLALLLTLLSARSLDGVDPDVAQLAGDERALTDGRARLVAQGLAVEEPDGLDIDPRIVYLVAVAADPEATLRVATHDGSATYHSANGQLVEIVQRDDGYEFAGLTDPSAIVHLLDDAGARCPAGAPIGGPIAVIRDEFAGSLREPARLAELLAEAGCDDGAAAAAADRLQLPPLWIVQASRGRARFEAAAYDHPAGLVSSLDGVTVVVEPWTPTRATDLVTAAVEQTIARRRR